MALRNLSLKAKLASAFAALSLLVVLVSCLSLLALRNEHRSFSGYVEETALRAKHANDVLDAANARAVSARNLVLVTTPADIAQEKAAVTRAHDKVGTVLATLQADLAKMGNVTARERETFAALLAVEARYGPLALNIVGMALEGKKDAAVVKMNAECRPLLAELTAAAGAYLQAIEAQSHAEVAAADAANGLNVAITLGGCVLALAAAALLAWLLTRAVVVPIDEAVRVARTVAAGDLRSRIEVRSSDETGKLLGALKTMNAGLVEIVRSVRESSDSIATGSAQIATGNADLSARTEQQASSLQQTAASMEQMNATVRSNAATTQQAAGLAQGASEAAAQGGVVVGQVVATMDQIADGSRKIAEIIGTIDGIAFQTNILALNAAVEAARAGEQGRGFAVVAGEVRSLAGRCAEAAREIKALIGASVERVDAGTRLVGEARSAMDGIVQQVKRVAGLIHEIGTATAEQTDGIGQVNVAVSSLDQTTQQNAALVEQSAAAAESLREQSARLARCVGVFQL